MNKQIQQLITKVVTLKKEIEKLLSENKKLKLSEKTHVQKYSDLLQEKKDLATNISNLKLDLDNALSQIKASEERDKSFITYILEFFKK